MRKKFFKLLVISAIALSMVFALVACNGNGNGNGTDASPINPDGSINLGTPGATLTTQQTEDLVEDFLDKIMDSTLTELGAFRIFRTFSAEEGTLTVEMVSNGTNAFYRYEVEWTENGTTYFERERGYYHNGVYYSHFSSYDGDEVFNERFVVVGSFIEVVQETFADWLVDILDIAEDVTARSYANGTRLTFEREGSDWSEAFTWIFDNDGRLVYFSEEGTETYDDETFTWELTFTITWGGSPTVPAPANIAQFIAPNADNAQGIDFWTWGDATVDGNNITLTVGGWLGGNVQIDWEGPYHWSWNAVTVTIANESIIELCEESLFSVDAIAAGTTTITLTSVAVPTLYITLTITVTA